MRSQGAIVAGSSCTLLDNLRFWPPKAGLLECGGATTDDSPMLRLLTPLAKLFTAKEAVAVVSEGEARMME